MNEIDPKVIVALDYSNAEQALDFVANVTAELCRLKIGKELFTAAGPDLVTKLVDRGFDIFLDLKFHDIPNTVNKAVRAACELDIWMLNVHAFGGREMLLAAKEGISTSTNGTTPKLIAVSVLTSTNQQDLNQLGIEKSLEQAVMDLTRMSLECGLDGMVCSAMEVDTLRAEFGQKPLFVTPGIRPVGTQNDDQKRIMTPHQAMTAGSSYLVIGRPVTQHADPAEALWAINQSLLE